MCKYFLMKCCIGICLVGLLCPVFAEGQGLGALDAVLKGKKKDTPKPAQKGGGVGGFGEMLGRLFEDSATTLGITTQESWLKSYTGQGLQHEQNGAWNEAVASYKEAADLLENLRGEFKESGDKESLVEQYLWVYTHLVNLSLRLNAPEDAFAYAERSKARSFLDQLAEASAGIRKGIDPDLLAEEQQYHRQLNDAWRTLGEKEAAYNASQSEMNRTPLEQELQGLQQRINELEQGLSNLQRTMRYRNRRYAELKYPQPISLKDVQKTILRDGECLLEYFWGDKELSLFVVGRKSFQALTLPVNEQGMTDQLKKLLSPVTDSKGSEINFPLALAIYRQILQPAEPYLQDITTLLIVPDGVLHYLPFEMLVTPPPDAPASENIAFADYHEASYLIRRYAIVYAPSASVLKPGILNSSAEHEPSENVFLALAPFTEQPVNHSELSGLALLEASGKEVETIGSLFPSGRKYALGAKALKTVMLDDAPRYRYVHLATHGLLDEKRPMYSGIAFHDDILRMHETFNLDLHADLVALSACQTGLGALRRGEGMVGLTRAFMYAGTPSVLVSLWSVADESTSRLMIEFYRNLNAGLNKAQALQQAKFTLIDENAQGGEIVKRLHLPGSPQAEKKILLTSAHPFYWAPFVLTGGWR